MKPQDIALLRRTLTQHFSEDDHALFVAACERSGLDPFARQVYAMHREGKLVIEATIDGLRLSAERTKQYAGQLGPEWCGPDGVWKDIWTEPEPPTAARVGIRRVDFADPVWGKALYSEYMQPGRFWRDMAANQLAKCAEALGFRKAFPQHFSGLYTPEEMAQAEQISQPVKVRDTEAGNGWAKSSKRGNDIPPQSGIISISASSVPTSEGKPRRVPTQPGDYAVRGGEVSDISSVPAPLQPFVEAGFGNRRNVQAAFGFLQVELEHALGAEGTAAFRRIYLRLPRIFPSKEACAKAHLNCWLEMWAAVQKGRAAA